MQRRAWMARCGMAAVNAFHPAGFICKGRGSHGGVVASSCSGGCHCWSAARGLLWKGIAGL
eukprot:4017639-Lingulodinium_polyedra.AAC.1